jgi:hypothetical protein
MDSERYAALIEELERATAGSRELDVAIGRACGLTPKLKAVYKRGHYPLVKIRDHEIWPPLSTSLDAALTLVPPECATLLALGHGAKSSVSIGTLGNAETKWIGDGAAPTGPLALCIAALRARQAMERGS